MCYMDTALPANGVSNNGAMQWRALPIRIPSLVQLQLDTMHRPIVDGQTAIGVDDRSARPTYPTASSSATFVGNETRLVPRRGDLRSAHGRCRSEDEGGCARLN